MKKLLFLINPLSGSGAGKTLAGRINAAMQKRLPPHDYDIVFTDKEVGAHAGTIAPQYETVIVAGGDGTINHTAGALIGLGNPPALGIIPLGTGNDLARSLGLLSVLKHKGLEALIDVFLEGSTRPVDVFTLGPRHGFISYAGFGRDAAVAGVFDRMRKKTPYRLLSSCGFSKLVYALLALACARQSCPAGLELNYQKADGSTKNLCFTDPLCQLIISSINSYGGGTCISSASRMDDAQFEITIMRNSPRWILLHLARFTGRAYDDLAPAGSVFQAREASLLLPEAVPAQIDGETIKIEPKSRLDVQIAGRLMMTATPQS